MNWIDLEKRLPDAYQNHLIISVTRGNYTFLAVAIYDNKDDLWYYVEKGEKGDLITDQVNAWVDNLGVFKR